MLRPMRTADGENHHASRRDVWPKLPSFQTTWGPAIFPPRQGIVKRAFPPLAANYSKNRPIRFLAVAPHGKAGPKGRQSPGSMRGMKLRTHSRAGDMECAQKVN